MESSPPDRLFAWFHTPRGYATLLTVAALLVGVGFLRESTVDVAEFGLLSWLLLAGVATILVIGGLGIAVPDRLGIEPKETWRVVLVLTLIGLLLIPTLFPV